MLSVKLLSMSQIATDFLSHSLPSYRVSIHLVKKEYRLYIAHHNVSTYIVLPVAIGLHQP